MHCRTSLLLLLLPTIAYSQSLNPTVRVRSEAAVPVSSDCEEGLRQTPMQRVNLHDTDDWEPAAATAANTSEAPATSTLRTQLRNVQKAAERNDAAAFFAALDAAKRTLAGYPRGGERTAAEETVRIYDDLARVWRYQLDNPTGSFFTAESELHRTVASYRGYDEAVRRQVYTDASQRRFYPASETRRFLTRAAADRLGDPRRERTPTPRVPAVEASVAGATPDTTALPAVRPRRSSTPASPSSGSPRTNRPSRSSAPVVAAAAAIPTPARTSTPAPLAARPITRPASPPISSPAVTTPAFTPDPIPTPAVAAPVAPAPSEAAPVTSEEPTTTSEATPTNAERTVEPSGATRRYVVPMLLIVVGLGVLVVLFKAKG
ncbi:MAG TPA: hypothetical protein VF618_08675 [Thermoanaerobaculia bacterium]